MRQFKKGVYIKDNVEYTQELINRHAEHLPVEEVNISDLNIDEPFFWKIDNLFDFINHVNRMNKKTGDEIIIIGKDMNIIDGNHRLAKAIIEGKKTIKVKKFRIFPHC